ncbi:hypothetical protein D3C85_1409300 [compost metagenome]
MLRLAVRRERQHHRLIADALHQTNKIGHYLRIVIAGKRVLHHQHGFRFLLIVQGFQLFQRHIGRPVADQLTLQ